MPREISSRRDDRRTWLPSPRPANGAPDKKDRHLWKSRWRRRTPSIRTATRSNAVVFFTEVLSRDQQPAMNPNA